MIQLVHSPVDMNSIATAGIDQRFVKHPIADQPRSVLCDFPSGGRFEAGIHREITEPTALHADHLPSMRPEMRTMA